MEHHPFFSIRQISASYPEPELQPDGGKRLVIVQGQKVLHSAGNSPSVIHAFNPLPPGTAPEGPLYLGMGDGIPFYTMELPGYRPVPEGYCLSAPRELYGTIPDDEVALAAYAIRILDFDRSTRFCGRCGKKTRPLRTERARFCTDCNRIVYPRLSPAIIVLIRKGDEVLLARSPGYTSGVYSVLAGFVEPGENLEDAVRREVAEEVGVVVENIRYFGSEPWPFPDSLMIGFVADYARGEIVIDAKEIESAAWFTRDNLPLLPSPISISRALIEAWRRGDM